MITEEKLQQFLDNLRIGKYDNLNYRINCKYFGKENKVILIQDVSKDVTMILEFYIDMKINRFSKEIPNTKTYNVDISSGIFKDKAIISKELFDSYLSYIDESVEQDKLIARANIEAAFGL